MADELTPRGYRKVEERDGDKAAAVNRSLDDIDEDVEGIDTRVNTVENILNDLVLMYEVVFYYPGIPASGHDVVRRIATKTYVFPSGMVGSQAQAREVPTAQTIFSIKKNGVTFGTITFDAGESLGSFAAASSTTINPGDVVSVVCPTPMDATLGFLAFSLLGSLVI